MPRLLLDGDEATAESMLARFAMPRPPRGPGDGDDDQEVPIGDPPDEDETDDPDDEDEGEEDDEPLYGAIGLCASGRRSIGA